MGTDDRLRAIANETTTELFRDGSGREADRLELRRGDGYYLGGWCFDAVRVRIEVALKRVRDLDHAD